MLFAWIGRLVERLFEVMIEPAATTQRQLLLRAVVLLAVLAGLMLAPIHLDRPWMTGVAVALLVLAVLALVGSAAVAGRVARRLTRGDRVSLLGGRVSVPAPELDEPVRLVEAWGRLARRVGVALPALVFFCGWALLFSVLWLADPGACNADPAVACGHAFHGAGSDPTYGDFLYFSINEAFANPPPDLLPASRLARTLATTEVLAGILLVTLYATAFFGLREARRRSSPSAPPAPVQETRLP